MARSRAFSHTQYVLINRLATPLGAFATLIMIGRHSDQLLGQYAVVMTFYFIMQMLPLLGLTTYVMREVARVPEDAGKYFNNVGFLSLLACVAVNFAVFGFVSIVEYPEAITDALMVCGALIFPGILVFISEIIFMSLHNARPVAIIAAIENSARVVVTLLVLLLDGGLFSIVMVFFVGRSLAFFAYLVVLKRERVVEKYGVLDKTVLLRIRTVLPTFLTGAMLFVVLNRLDFLVLSIFEDAAVVGYYAIAYRLLEISTIVLTALIMAVYPTIARNFVDDKLRYRVTVRNITAFFAVALVALSVVGVVFSEYYVSLLFSQQYPTPVLLTQLYIACLLIIGLDFVASGILMASDEQGGEVRSTAFGGGSSVLFLFTLIPMFGMYGAFIARVTATLIQLVVKFWYLERSIGSLWSKLQLFRLLLIAAVSYSLIPFLLAVDLPMRLLMVLLYLVVGVPVLVLLTRYFQPLRLLRFYFRRINATDVDSLPNLLEVMVSDQRAVNRYKNRGVKENPQSPARVAVIGYRVARFLRLQGYARLAGCLTYIRQVVFGLYVDSTVQTGPGLVVVNPRKVKISVDSGENLVCRGPVNLVTSPPGSS
ncbi:MAG TPA: hypothetical protein DCF45_09225 [Gammaproteobacteria bacterium]|nr:hypothetical protein [Gammaproteobacteria bacterium]